jgi:predicted aspartyl protease
MFGLGLFVAAAIAGAADVPAAPPRFESTTGIPAPTALDATDTVGFTRDKYRRMTLPVTLDGKGPFRFLVDTGSDRSVISRELAATLLLRSGPRARLLSVTGESVVGLAVISNLQLSRKAIDRIDAPLLNAADIGADGILGIDALRAERLSFDFVRRTVGIADRAAEPEDRDAIVVRAKRRDGRLVITDASAERQHVSVVIDTGSQYSIGNDALRQALERRGALDLRGPVELVSVTGSILRGELAVIRDVKLGQTTIRGLAIVFADARTFGQLGLDRRPAMLLGMSGLESFDRVSIDFANRKLRLVVSNDAPPDGG